MSEVGRRRIWSVCLIVAVGCLTGYAHLQHLFSEPGAHTELLGAVFPLGLSLLLASAGGWLYRSSLADEHLHRVVAWTGGGLVGGLVLGYPVVPYQLAHGVTMVDIPYLFANWATSGALAGFLIGVYSARQSQYHDELAAERSELATRKDELKRQNERLDQFASVVSHDLRNPLNVAEARLEFLREEDEEEHLDAIETALERMEALIDDVLRLARQGRPIDETERVTLSALADRAWSVVETDDARLRTDGDLVFEADPDRLQQLFENLFRNALDHGGPDVTVRVGVLPTRTGFYVVDDGPGIPADEREDVFTSGYSTTEDGTGFGLAIVAEIVEAHDWEIQLTESDSGGVRFEMTGIEDSGGSDRS